MRKIFNFLILNLTVLASLIPSSALARSLPEMLVGQTETVVDGQTHFWGMSGNYAVLNYDPDSSYGFNTIPLFGCLRDVVGACFVLGTGLNGQGNAGTKKMLVSDTTAFRWDGRQIGSYELPVIFLGGVNIVGDAYGVDLNNFAFWGRNLAESTGSVSQDTGAAWRLGSYILNPEAQSAWSSEESNRFRDEKLNVLQGEAKTIAAGELNAVAEISLQGDSLSAPTDRFKEEADYPQGKVWLHDGDLTLNDLTYHGLGTLIVKGNLTINGDILRPGTLEPNHKYGLGLIVEGNVTIADSVHLQAAIIALNNPETAGTEGNMTINNNVLMTGSFIALNYPQLSSRQNVQIFYDYAFDDQWPPGFRSLNFAGTENIGNR